MEIKGDFLGFSFGGIRSEQLGITRVSSGDRYEEELHPEIIDLNAEVPGMDGNYYFGSTFGTRTINVEIAFDSMTEYQFHQMKKVFGTRQIRELIFDESPYKKYLAKIESPIQLSYICFDEPRYTWQKIQTGYNEYMKGVSGNDYEYKNYDGTKQRIYKGEGKISFVCYFPYAKSVFKVLQNENIDSDWAISSGILSNDDYVTNNIDVYSAGAIKVYNAGDLPVGFRLYVPGAQSEELRLTYNGTGAELVINPYTLQTGDVGILINTDNQLIQGVNSAPSYDDQSGNVSYSTSGTIYNKYIDSGYFFKLETNVPNDYDTITITNGKDGIQIFYDYLYF